MRRAARLAALAVVVVAGLSGCVRLTSTTEVHADDTFSQVAVIAMTDAAGAQLQQLAGVSLDDLEGTITASEPYLKLANDYPGQLTVSDYADGDLEGVQITATELPLGAFEAAFSTAVSQLPLAGKATLVHADDTFVVSVPAGDGANLLAGTGISPGQLKLLGSQVDVRLSFSFPGLVQSATAGEVDGNSVTLGLTDLLAGKDITIVANAGHQINWKPWLIWGGVTLAVLVIVGGAAALIAQDVRRHRATALPSPMAPAGPAGGPGILGEPEVAAPEAPAPEAPKHEAPVAEEATPDQARDDDNER